MSSLVTIIASQEPRPQEAPEESKPQHLIGLDSQQLHVAESSHKALVVLAGAGTGKTRAAVAWAQERLARGVSGERIALLTFTNRAAAEMRERLISMTGAIADGVFCGTFHSFAAWQMRMNASRLGLPSGTSIMDEKDVAHAIAICCNKFGIKHYRLREREHISGQSQTVRLHETKGYCLDDIVGAMKFALASCKPPGEYLKTLTKSEKFSELYDEYLRFQRTNGLIDFDHLLMFLWSALKRDMLYRMTIAAQFTHVLVDEVQDNNAQQFEILEHIGHTQRVIIGDLNQSIYGFRGALPTGVDSFTKKHPDCKIITLTKNYRSVPQIVEYVNSTLVKDEAVKMVPARKEKGDVHLFAIENTKEAVMRTVGSIRRSMEDGVKGHEISVIFRNTTHPAVRMIEEALEESGVRYQRQGGNEVATGVEMGMFHSIVKAAYNPRDVVSLMRALQMVPFATPAAVQLAVENYGLTGLSALEDPFTNLRDVLLRLRNRDFDFKSSLNAALRLFRKYRHMQSNTDFEARMAPVDASVAAWVKNGADLVQIATSPLMTRRMGWRVPEHVCLTTIHSAKGLEWENVHFFWDLPTEVPQVEDSASERRNLAYVATTRARDTLHIYSAGAGSPQERGSNLQKSIDSNLRPFY